jgi:hypothetical protein
LVLALRRGVGGSRRADGEPRGRSAARPFWRGRSPLGSRRDRRRRGRTGPCDRVVAKAMPGRQPGHRRMRSSDAAGR